MPSVVLTVATWDDPNGRAALVYDEDTFLVLTINFQNAEPRDAWLAVGAHEWTLPAGQSGAINVSDLGLFVAPGPSGNARPPGRIGQRYPA